MLSAAARVPAVARSVWVLPSSGPGRRARHRGRQGGSDQERPELQRPSRHLWLRPWPLRRRWASVARNRPSSKSRRPECLSSSTFPRPWRWLTSQHRDETSPSDLRPAPVPPFLTPSSGRTESPLHNRAVSAPTRRPSLFWQPANREAHLEAALYRTTVRIVS